LCSARRPGSHDANSLLSHVFGRTLLLRVSPEPGCGRLSRGSRSVRVTSLTSFSFLRWWSERAPLRPPSCSWQRWPGADVEVVRLAYLGISRLVLAYFLSHNTIHSTSRALFILPAEHPRPRARVAATRGGGGRCELSCARLVLAAVMAWGARSGARGGAPSRSCRQRWPRRMAVAEHPRTRAANGGRGELPHARGHACAAGGGLGELPRACARDGGRGRSSLASALCSRRDRGGAPLHPRRCSRPRQKCLMKCQLQGSIYPSV
jgi:hypothetical protein